MEKIKFKCDQRANIKTLPSDCSYSLHNSVLCKFKDCKQLTNQAVGTCANADKWAQMYSLLNRICPIVAWRSKYSVCVCVRVLGDRNLPLCLSLNPPSKGKCAKHRLHSACNLQGHHRQHTCWHIWRRRDTAHTDAGWPSGASNNNRPTVGSAIQTLS